MPGWWASTLCVRWSGPVGDVVALCPAVPGGEGVDVKPVVADGRCHRVEEFGRVAVAQLFVGVALLGEGSGMAFDGGGGALPGSFEVVLGAVELLLGDVEVAARSASMPAWRGVVAVVGGVMVASRCGGSGLGVTQGVAVDSGGGGDVGEHFVHGGSYCSRLCSACCLFGVARFGVVQGASGVVEDGGEPVGDLITWRRLGRRRGVGAGNALGEGAALRGGGDVGPIDSDDGLEDVAGFRDVAAVGDYTDLVVVASTGGGDVQAAAAGCG